MRARLFNTLLALCYLLHVAAQNPKEAEKQDWKQNLFTGGTVSLGFFNNTFLIGANPVFGYSFTNWAELALQVNFSYNSVRDYNGIFNNKLRQTTYGAGPFIRIYPMRFVFAQAQLEHNFIRSKNIPINGPAEVRKNDVGSVLIGGGYTSNRSGRGGEPFYYLSMLFDVSGNILSPYTDNFGRATPVFRAGLQFPLFQGAAIRSYKKGTNSKGFWRM
ncbi:MAG: hypothetical protein RL555_1089 [Bacteroidota bacterium]|jgi:hypothetical protein